MFGLSAFQVGCLVGGIIGVYTGMFFICVLNLARAEKRGETTQN